MSDYGLDGEDVSTINKTQGAAAIEYGYFKDVTIDGSTKALRVKSKPDKVSQLELVDGQSQLDSAWDQLEAGRAQLESGRADLDANWPKLVSANNLINQNQRPTTPR